MNKKFCQSCGATCLSTMAYCPKCGGEQFGSSPPTPRVSKSTQSQTFAPPVSAARNTASGAAKPIAMGFGIAALVIAILALSVPIVGVFVSALATVLAVVAALAGDRIFATATPLIAFVNTMFLSPSTWIFLGGNDPSAKSFMTAMIVVVAALPFIAMVLNATGKIVIGAKKTSP